MPEEHLCPAQEPVVDRSVLPFPRSRSGSVAGRTMQESIYDPTPPPQRLPADAPNILIILIDDAGPALPAALGGAVHTPTLEPILSEGIGYNRFHTTAMCSPTRASLLTGRNHHRVGSGVITEFANGWDGYLGVIPRSSALQAEVLRQYGYATAAFGKWHNTPGQETSAAGFTAPRSEGRGHRRKPLVGSRSMSATAALHPDGVRSCEPYNGGSHDEPGLAHTADWRHPKRGRVEVACTSFPSPRASSRSSFAMPR